MLYLTIQSPPPQSAMVKRALQAADGYLYLRMPKEALGELDDLDPEEREDSPVMLARIRVLLHMRRWRSAEKLSMSGQKLHPSEDEFTVQRAFALHQLSKTDEAMQVISAAPEWIRRTGILHYNLACYEARLGSLDTARECIGVAIQMNEAIQKNARKDPDLAKLWN